MARPGGKGSVSADPGREGEKKESLEVFIRHL
jgi:hypothetical protein